MGAESRGEIARVGGGIPESSTAEWRHNGEAHRKRHGLSGSGRHLGNGPGGVTSSARV